MAKRFRLLRGLEANVPVLLEGELGYTTDTKKLYVGSSTGNIELGQAATLLAAIAAKVDAADVLKRDNTGAFSPSGDYNPATKKYVDDAVSGFSAVASGISVTPSGNLSATDAQAALEELQADINAINSGKADKSNVVEKDNTTIFTPTGNYNPATKKYVDDELNALINAAPGTLDTLNELAAAIGDDPNFASTLSSQIGDKADQSSLDTHIADGVKHITATERTNWNGAKSSVDSHVADSGKHVTSGEKTTWNAKVDVGVTNALDGRLDSIEAGYDCGAFTDIA